MSTLAEVTTALEALACPGDPVRLGAGSLHLYCATSSGRCPEKAAAGSPVHRLTLRYAGYAREWTVYPAQVYTRSKSRWYAERIYRLTPECVAHAATMIEGLMSALCPATVTRFAGKVMSPRWPPEDPCPVDRCVKCARPLFFTTHECPKRH